MGHFYDFMNNFYFPAYAHLSREKIITTNFMTIDDRITFA